MTGGRATARCTTTGASPVRSSPTFLLTYELPRRARPAAVAVNVVHPGLVSTSFGTEDPGRAQRLLVPVLRPFMKSAAQGTATPIHVAWAPELRGVTGSYFARSRPRRSSPRSHDEAVAARLWQVSSELTGFPDG
jgi:retinol dehydrogenase-14